MNKRLNFHSIAQTGGDKMLKKKWLAATSAFLIVPTLSLPFFFGSHASKSDAV